MRNIPFLTLQKTPEQSVFMLVHKNLLASRRFFGGKTSNHTNHEHSKDYKLRSNNLEVIYNRNYEQFMVIIMNNNYEKQNLNSPEPRVGQKNIFIASAVGRKTYVGLTRLSSPSSSSPPHKSWLHASYLPLYSAAIAVMLVCAFVCLCVVVCL